MTLAIMTPTPEVDALRARALGEEALRTLFTEARSHNAWLPEPVCDATLRQLYGLLSCGPTSMNSHPGHFVFLRTAQAKERLVPALSPGNVEKTRAAPVTVIVGYDLDFWRRLPKLFPHKDVRAYYENREQFTSDTAFRNSSLQGAYLMIAARALGLDIGAMSGFDQNKVNEAFFPRSTIRANFLCNLGYGHPRGLWDRLPRPAFEEACRIA